jgi:hypothetical protein
MTNAIEMLALLAEDLTTQELIECAIKTDGFEGVFLAIDDINNSNENTVTRLTRAIGKDRVLVDKDSKLGKELAEAEYQVVQYKKQISKFLEAAGIEGSGKWVPVANIKQQAALEEFIENLKNIY